MRVMMFFIGFGMLLVGAASNFPSIPLPFDCRSIVCKISFTSFSLDVVLMVVGIFLILISWVMKKLAQ